MIEAILYALILATSIPAGLLLAWLCDDELAVFRRYLIITVYCIAILAVLLSVIAFNMPIILSLVYSAIVLGIMIKKGCKKKKKR